MTVEEPRSPKPASPAVAAFLSFVLPGLGQLAVGARRRALVLGLPLVLVVALGVLLFLFDRSGMIGAIVQPNVILALIILDLLLGLIHFIAVGDAYRLARRRVARSAWQMRAGAPSLLAFLLVLTIGIHGGLGAIGFETYTAMEDIYAQPSSSSAIPIPSFMPTGTPAPGATPSPTAVPGPAWAADGRLNILLIGGDSGPGRIPGPPRTDTMILFSADVATGKVAMFGIPRNLYNAPLAPEDAKAFPGGIFPYPNLLNSLWVYANANRDRFPGAGSTAPPMQQAGFRALTGSIQQLMGVPLDGAVVVNLNGFVDLVDALGKVWINVPFKMVDYTYPNPATGAHMKMVIQKGCQQMDGFTALAFARIRHIDSDYARMGRQQVVLDALARQLDPLTVLTKLPDLLQIAGANLTTTFTPDDAATLAQFATTLDVHHIRNITFVPPTYKEFLTPAIVAKIQKVVQNVFVVKPTPSPTPFDGPSPSSSPVPTRTPAPTPVPCPAN